MTFFKRGMEYKGEILFNVFFCKKKLDGWLCQQAVEELFPEQPQGVPQQVCPTEGNPSTPASQVLRQGPTVVAVPSTEKGKSKGKSKPTKGPNNPN